MTLVSRHRFAFLVLFATMLALPAAAQPYNAWLAPSGNPGSYLRVPSSTSLNFTGAFTFEAWVSGRDATGGCSSLAGKNYVSGWWVGVCGTSLRSYLRGAGSQLTAGTVPVNDWTHVAVVWDGTHHLHYIDGELVESRVETGDMTNNTDEMRIASDVSWDHPFAGAMDEVRIWNVARTRDEIRANINKPLSSAPGLVAVYHFDGSAVDATGANNGSSIGSIGYLNAPVGGACTGTATQLCLGTGRFGVNVTYLTSTGTAGDGKVVTGAGASTPGSGLFWFFASDNWELLVKALDGCGINNRKWVFSAATTDVHYEMAVTDYTSGTTKRYFNYLGAPAPATTDTGAFATCP